MPYSSIAPSGAAQPNPSMAWAYATCHAQAYWHSRPVHPETEQQPWLHTNLGPTSGFRCPEFPLGMLERTDIALTAHPHTVADRKVDCSWLNGQILICMPAALGRTLLLGFGQSSRCKLAASHPFYRCPAAASDLWKGHALPHFSCVRGFSWQTGCVRKRPCRSAGLASRRGYAQADRGQRCSSQPPFRLEMAPAVGCLGASRHVPESRMSPPNPPFSLRGGGWVGVACPFRGSGHVLLVSRQRCHSHRAGVQAPSPTQPPPSRSQTGGLGFAIRPLQVQGAVADKATAALFLLLVLFPLILLPVLSPGPALICLVYTSCLPLLVGSTTRPDGIMACSEPCRLFPPSSS